MIIVSQDRKSISNFANIIGMQINEHIANSDGEKDYEIIVVTEKRECIVAIYETEERAIEVLQEIARLISVTQIDSSYQEARLTFEFKKMLRYEMPEE